ncbi:MAG: hypothetical protein JWO45_1410, partial [Spartobacteria bacterium]|nr:hypothetical protein [Spartobacteria bacterium]
PNESNYRKTKLHLENYAGALDKQKEELRTRVLPAPALAPNEFQSRLRQAMLSVTEKARANKVKLPDNFALGFEEYTSALPTTAAAPLLGQELAQVELLVNILLDARVDGIATLGRKPLPEERGAAAAPTPAAGRKPAPTAAGPKLIERGIIDVTFSSSSSADRKVLNQIATSTQQFYIVRLLHVKNEKEKGPPREPSSPAAAATAQPTPAKPSSAAELNFIVGNEHIETSARIELIRFTF